MSISDHSFSTLKRSTRGGYRPNAGRKKGGKWPSTLDKTAARDGVRNAVIAELIPMLQAHIRERQGSELSGGA